MPEKGWIKLHGWGMCKRCGKQVHESHRHLIDNDGLYCFDCSFIIGKISDKDYIEGGSANFGTNLHVAVNHEGEIVYWTGKNKIPPWERTDRQQRSSPQYNEWRKAVYERDNYTCQDCRQRGGILNAHHLKSFKKYKRLRYKVNNGITLCETCHRKRHSKRRCDDA